MDSNNSSGKFGSVDMPIDGQRIIAKRIFDDSITINLQVYCYVRGCPTTLDYPFGRTSSDMLIMMDFMRWYEKCQIAKRDAILRDLKTDGKVH